MDPGSNMHSVEHSMGSSVLIPVNGVTLAHRLLAATRWAYADPRTAAMPVGCLGASTGACAALVATARELDFRAAGSRGGRP